MSSSTFDQDFQNAQIRPMIYGLEISNLRSNVHLFEMHQPYVKPIRIVKIGTVHSAYFETKAVPNISYMSHAYAKGRVYHSLDSLNEARQRRFDAGKTDDPMEVYRWSCFMSSQIKNPDFDPNNAFSSSNPEGTKQFINTTLKFMMPNGCNFKWRKRQSGPGVNVERTYEDEVFYMSCAGPCDVLMDGRVDEDDLRAFIANPYDWDEDGQEPGPKDIYAFEKSFEHYIRQKDIYEEEQYPSLAPTLSGIGKISDGPRLNSWKNF